MRPIWWGRRADIIMPSPKNVNAVIRNRVRSSKVRKHLNDTGGINQVLLYVLPNKCFFSRSPNLHDFSLLILRVPGHILKNQILIQKRRNFREECSTCCGLTLYFACLVVSEPPLLHSYSEVCWSSSRCIEKPAIKTRPQDHTLFFFFWLFVIVWFQLELIIWAIRVNGGGNVSIEPNNCPWDLGSTFPNLRDPQTDHIFASS